MIRDRVVFILGAGASVPFGFPTGERLVKLILNVRKEHVPNKLNGQMCDAVCKEMGFDPGLMQDLQLVLRHSQVKSIDEFLAQPSHDHFTAIGRFLIAAHLLPCEDSEKLFADGEGANRNWYQLLWSYLTDYQSVEELIENAHVTFVTFNYDRSLEHYLFTVFRHFFGAPSARSEQFLRDNIFHVHGTLGSYRQIGSAPRRPYITKCDLKAIKAAMEGIRVVHEVDRIPENEEITRRIEKSDRLVFLGFQYHIDNVRKLLRNVKSRKMQVSGSCYGLSDMECATARKRLAEALQMDANEVKVGGCTKLGCHEYLREYFDFS